MSELKNWREWVDLSPHKKEIKSLASGREKQKKSYKSSRQWSSEATNLTGLKGEFAFSLCTGIPVDKTLKSKGDSGVDFSWEGILYDVKSTLFEGVDPALLEMANKKLVPHVYVLVRIKGWKAKIIGWASRKQMRHSQKRDFGNGDRLSFLESEMKELEQNTIPPHVPSTSTEPRIAAQRSALQKTKTDIILKLPKEIGEPENKDGSCFPHGPFIEKPSKHSSYPALYCKKCGRFYGINKS
tara:strand:- start:423 stop:1145 length:723 start_codon:yes stop_codon:yes gene_type:complete